MPVLSSERARMIATRHGLYGGTLWMKWQNMMTRCYNIKHDSFRFYGGRGIVVCDRWRDIRLFASDMGTPPEGASLDRIDNNRNYEPANCRWSNPKGQANNRRNNVVIAAFCESKTVAQWSSDRRCSVRQTTIYNRISRGWDSESAISTPPIPAHLRNARRSYTKESA